MLPKPIEDALGWLMQATAEDSRIAEAETATRQAIASEIDRLNSLLQRKQDVLYELVGHCPHGYLFCFYCWRDAGFPGGGRDGR